MSDQRAIERAIAAKGHDWWTQQDIADEVHCTKSWVSQVMTRMDRTRFDERQSTRPGRPIEFRLRTDSEVQALREKRARRAREVESQRKLKDAEGKLRQAQELIASALDAIRQPKVA